MKKLFKLGVALLMSCSLFILASCGDKDPTKEPDTLTVEQAKENIEKCGLAVDVSLKANIGATACTVYLDAETGTFEAYDESKPNASLRSASDIKGTLVFKGAFFYNQELWFKVEAQVAADGTESEPEVKYYTVSVDLSKVNEAVLTADGEVDYTSVLVEDKTTTTQSTESDYNEQQKAFEESVKDLDKFREDSKPESEPPAENPPTEEDPNNPLAGKTFVRSEVNNLGNDMQQWTYLTKYVFKKDMTMEMIYRQFTGETISHDKYTYTIDVENKTFTTVCTEYDLGDGTFIHSAEEAKEDWQKGCFEGTTYKYFLSDDHMVVQPIQDGSYMQGQIWIPLSKNPKFYENKVCRAVRSGQNGDVDVFITSNGFVHFYFYSMGGKSICYNVEDENNEFALKYHKVFYETANSDDFDIYYREDADFNISHSNVPFYYAYEKTAKGINLSSKIAPGQSLAELAEAGGLVVFAYDDANVSVSISPTAGVAVSPVGENTYYLSINLSGENKVTFTRKAEPKTAYEYTYELKFTGDVAKLELTAVSQNVAEQLEGLSKFTMDYEPMDFEFEVVADFDEIK